MHEVANDFEKTLETIFVIANIISICGQYSQDIEGVHTVFLFFR